MSNESRNWELWHENLSSSLSPKEMREMKEFSFFQSEVKKAKRAGKFKLLAAFGIGSTIGTGVTAYVAYRIFKLILGGLL
jgi:hypothetical protein